MQHIGKAAFTTARVGDTVKLGSEIYTIKSRRRNNKYNLLNVEAVSESDGFTHIFAFATASLKRPTKKA